MSKREQAQRVIRECEQKGARFYVLANGEFGLALGRLQLSRHERRQLEQCREEIAAICLQRAQALMRPQSQMVN